LTRKRQVGSISKLPSGSWRVRFRTPEAKRISKTFKTKADANAFIATQQTDVLRGGWIDPRASEITLNTYATKWLIDRKSLAPRTSEVYQWLLTKKVLPYLGSKKLNQIKPATVENWFSSLHEDTPSTAAKAYRVLRTCLNDALRDELLLKTLVL
jgi:hypothetical protein